MCGGKREYEGYVSHLQEQLKGYRDDTISKWGSKAHLSSGKISNKSFLNVDQSILGQVAQVKGRERCVCVWCVYVCVTERERTCVWVRAHLFLCVVL